MSLNLDAVELWVSGLCAVAVLVTSSSALGGVWRGYHRPHERVSGNTAFPPGFLASSAIKVDP